MDRIEELKGKIEKFIEERDWDKYHSPKNLAISISIEAAELLEIFQWKSGKESYSLKEEELERVKEEVGDIFIYLLNLCSKLNIDPIDSAFNKLRINERKYPAEMVKGKAFKYNHYLRKESE
jgi:NTP pyrophosphatase (non-canonical NTP hydrolase)